MKHFTNEQIDDLTELFSVAFDAAGGDKLRAAVLVVVNAAVDIKDRNPRHTRLIVRTVCELFGVRLSDFRRGSKASNAISDARFVAAWVLRERCGYSYQAIGAILNRDHSTVVHGVGKVARDLRLQAMARKALDLLEHVEASLPRREAA